MVSQNKEISKLSSYQILHKSSYVVLVIILLSILGCHKQDQAKKEDTIVTKVQIKDAQDSIVVSFPSGSTKSTQATVTKASSTDIENVFKETSEMFRVGSVLPYQIVLNIGKEAPLNDSITISFWLPSSFRNSIPTNQGVELFAQICDSGEMETLDFFDIIESKYDPLTGKLVATLPVWVFTTNEIQMELMKLSLWLEQLLE